MLAFIEARLGEPALSPFGIAAPHFISVRYLYKLFEPEQATVGDWIRHRRLERCRSDLLDPTHRHTPLATIAQRWGFKSAAHFSRAVRAATASHPPTTAASLSTPEASPTPSPVEPRLTAVTTTTSPATRSETRGRGGLHRSIHSGISGRFVEIDRQVPAPLFPMHQREALARGERKGRALKADGDYKAARASQVGLRELPQRGTSRRRAVRMQGP
jgi:AraC-like DNA-binding protein